MLVLSILDVTICGFFIFHVPAVRSIPLLVFIDVSSSNIYQEDQEKYCKARSISQINTVVFILVQTLLKSNSHTSSLVVLCYEIRCPR
jgi:hypothetical protein